MTELKIDVQGRGAQPLPVCGVVTVREGWRVVETDDGTLLAEQVAKPGAWWPVAPVVELTRLTVTVRCPICRPRRRNGRPIRHSHGNAGRVVGEGHRVAHCATADRPPGAPSGYVVLLLDAGAVKLEAGIVLEP